MPASESPKALRYLRDKAGSDVVIITDARATNMAAASSSLGLKPVGASLRALRAVYDLALICGRHPLRAPSARSATQSSRAGLVRSSGRWPPARRIVTLKSSYGLAPR